MIDMKGPRPLWAVPPWTSGPVYMREQMGKPVSSSVLLQAQDRLPAICLFYIQAFTELLSTRQHQAEYPEGNGTRLLSLRSSLVGRNSYNQE